MKLLEIAEAMNAQELEDTIKELKIIVKDKKAQEKEDKKILFEETVKEGDKVLFVFKDDEYFGIVVKVNKASFTAEFEYNGETIKKAIQFHKFVGKTGLGEEEASAAASA